VARLEKASSGSGKIKRLLEVVLIVEVRVDR
jgi:hypothetical protein